MPTLSEAASKQLLGGFGVPFPPERVVGSADDAVGAADAHGYPVVVKLGGVGIAHKTERGLVRLGLGSAEQVRDAAVALLAAATPDDGDVHLLVAPMLRATRELIAGLHRDPQFGMTVMLGVGGVLAEAVADVTLRSRLCWESSVASRRSTGGPWQTCCWGCRGRRPNATT